MNKHRIPRTIVAFYAYMKDTVLYMLKASTPPESSPSPVGEGRGEVAAAPAAPAQTNWQRLGWTQEEMNKWQSFSTLLEPLYVSYTDKKAQRTTNVTVQIYKIIDDCLDYDQQFHLLDRIAISPNGNSTDYETFNIKRNTFLEDNNPSRAPEPGITEPVLEIVKMKHLVHQLLVTFPNRKGRSKPKGVKEVLVYRARTASPNDMPAQAGYQYAGDVKRGLFNSIFDMGDVGLCGWYIARIKTASGEFGPWSAPVSAMIA